MTTISNTAALIAASRLNPSSVMETILNTCEEATEGKYDIVTASSPFMYCLEANVVMATVEMDNHLAILRKLYPELAVTQDDLYCHMSDQDYIGRFSTPSKAPFKMGILKEELKNAAVQVDGSSVKKLVIPKDSFITISDYVFTFMYPMELRVLNHGGLQIVWDLDNTNPLYEMTSNVVEWSEVETQAGTLILIEFNLFQFEITSNTTVIDTTSGYNKNFFYKDDYYYCRVYTSVNGTDWVECRTTHSDLTYDPSVVTAVLKVTEGNLNVSIPQVYLSTGLASGMIRVDIHTTKGKLDAVLSDYDVNAYVKTWVDHGSESSSAYSAPLGDLKYVVVFSDGSATGGTDGIEFSDLRDKVIKQATTVSLPITGAQLETSLQNLGYGLVLSRDTITKRIYLATRELPSYTGTTLLAGANCSLDTLTTKFSELVTLPTVADNGDRVTIKPGTLFKYQDGLLTLVTQRELSLIDAAKLVGNDALCNLVNQNEYIYTPFYYVLDASGSDFTCLGYHLNAPEVVSRHFVKENDTAEIEVSTDACSLVLTDSGYKLYVQVVAGSSYQQLLDSEVHCQLAYTPEGESDTAYLNGKFYGTKDSQRVWEFDLGTNFDIIDGNLVLNTFSMYKNAASNTKAALTTKFNIYHCVSAGYSSTYTPGELDEELNTTNLPENVVPVTKEAVTLKFGTALTYLWSNSRTVAGEEDYLRYNNDVVDTYEENEYEKDPDTGFNKIALDADGNPTLNLLHAKGDIKYNEDGSVQYAHYAGELILDANKEPIVASQRKLVRQVDLFLLEGVFNFATYAADVSYVDTLADQVVTYLEEDISSISNTLLEETVLYYSPKRTLGQTKVYVGDSAEQYINARLSFEVKYYLDEQSFKNTALRTTLTTTAKKVINEKISATSVSVSEINESIRSALGANVVPVDIEIKGSGLNQALTNFRLYDESSYCTVNRVLRVNPDSTMEVVDDITVQFIKIGS